MQDFGTQIAEMAWRNRGKLMGTLIACVMGWIFLTHGLLRALVVLGFLFAGYYLGSRLDAGQSPVPEWASRYGVRRRGKTR